MLHGGDALLAPGIRGRHSRHRAAMMISHCLTSFGKASTNAVSFNLGRRRHCSWAELLEPLLGRVAGGSCNRPCRRASLCTAAVLSHRPVEEASQLRERHLAVLQLKRRSRQLRQLRSMACTQRFRAAQRLRVVGRCFHASVHVAKFARLGCASQQPTCRTCACQVCSHLGQQLLMPLKQQLSGHSGRMAGRTAAHSLRHGSAERLFQVGARVCKLEGKQTLLCDFAWSAR